MKVIDDLTKIDLEQETILTIGAFDGLHRGHQALIGEVVDRARATGCQAVVITFHPHPIVVLAPERAPRYLTTPGQKIALLESMGVDLVVLMPFDRRIRNLPPRDFMQMVVDHLRLRELWVGADFGLGRDREGDAHHLRLIGQEMGFDVHRVEPLILDGQVVSSSRIRALLAEGSVAEAARLLGRYPSLSGEVVPGAGRGQAMGFPTANLEVRSERAVPADGVYAVMALLGSERYPAMANIGVRPSFDSDRRTVETHIFGHEGDIYGCDLVVEFVARLRDERRFRDIDDLVDQIGRDSEAARQVLAGLDELGGPGGAAGSCRYRTREVGHTADRALQVWGHDLPNFFIGAARGMYAMMADLEDLVAVDWREIRLAGLDREALLVDWLNELLFLTETEGLIFVTYWFETLAGPGPGSKEAVLVAQAGGMPAPVTKAHIKAATYHNLALEREDSGWSTEITFDV